MISRNSHLDILPLSAFEEYMFLDDRPGHPMSILLRLRFDQPLDPAAARDSFDQALQRHPLLRARVIRDPRRGWVWVVGRGERSPFWHLGEVPTDHFPSAGFLDLRESIGLRGWTADYHGGALLFVQAHHACCDGLGLSGFLRDWLALYAGLRGCPLAGPLPTLDDEGLHARNCYGLTPAELLRASRRQIAEAARNRHYLLREPIALVPAPSSLAQEVEVGPQLLSTSLTTEETAALTTAATEAGVTTNDLLIRDLFSAIVAWREELHETGELPPLAATDWIRLLVPMSLRRPEDELLSAANIVGMAFFDRRVADIPNPDRLLRGIGCEMQLMKRYHLAQLFVLSLLISRRTAGGIPRVIAGDHCCATTLLSNLGDPLKHSALPRHGGYLRVGDSQLVGFELAAPVRRRTHSSFAVNFYGGRLNITMQLDPAAIPSPIGERLLHAFVRQTTEERREARSERRE